MATNIACITEVIEENEKERDAILPKSIFNKNELLIDNNNKFTISENGLIINKVENFNINNKKS
jgi:hypothetical protein